MKKLKGKKQEFSLKEMKTRGILVKKDNLYLPFSGYFAHLIKNNNLEVKREKIGDRGIMKNVKEVLDIVKTGKEIVTDKGE